ncbi:MAG: amidohydrolase [Oscillospiraceae bacterium]|nr:amidohydrolase [Oscillospiraceae bacterium]
MLKEKLYDILSSKTEEIIEIRRYLHKYPEISFQEFKTAEYIRDFYTGKDIEWIRYPVGLNGIAVKIKGGANKNTKKRKTLAIRGDFDALAIQEETEVAYKSVNPGAMHACGHDAHTAILLIVADALIQVREDLPGDVVIIHQYAEEVSPGGAKFMIDDGILDNVDAVIGGHVWVSYEPGIIAVRAGMAMAGRSYFKVIITGSGGHGSQPHKCVDPILAASHFVVAAQSIISRNLDPAESAVITFGRFEGLGKFNIIPNNVTLDGDVRICSESVSDLIEKRFTEILAGISAAYGCSYELVYEHDYSPVINDEKLCGFAEKFINANSIPELKLIRGEITMGSEDFSYYQQKIPGLYVFFGAKPGGEVFPHHHAKFNINENCLVNCAKFYAGFTIDFLESLDN